MLSSSPHLGLRSDLFFSSFPTTILYAFLMSHESATCSTHLNSLHSFTLITCGEDHVLWRSS
jgi:hypothetical protein